jgi:hypothetical protein
MFIVHSLNSAVLYLRGVSQAYNINKNADKMFFNCVIVFFDPENVCLDTKIVFLSGLEVEIQVEKDFNMAAIL